MVTVILIILRAFETILTPQNGDIDFDLVTSEIKIFFLSFN